MQNGGSDFSSKYANLIHSQKLYMHVRCWGRVGGLWWQFDITCAAFKKKRNWCFHHLCLFCLSACIWRALSSAGAPVKIHHFCFFLENKSLNLSLIQPYLFVWRCSLRAQIEHGFYVGHLWNDRWMVLKWDLGLDLTGRISNFDQGEGSLGGTIA